MVGIRGTFSERIDVISGVPQGSVLGPRFKDVITEEDAGIMREDLICRP